MVELSEATGAFVEAAFKEVENAQRKKKLDPMVSANISSKVTRGDRSFSRLHPFLLDPIPPLVHTLELA